MNILKIYQTLSDRSRFRFTDIVFNADILFSESGEPHKLRLEIIDGSFIDVFYSVTGKYSFHWERTHIDGTIYRHDNAPHGKWKHIRTFPKHFHYGSQENVKESSISNNPADAIEEFLEFVRINTG